MKTESRTRIKNTILMVATFLAITALALGMTTIIPSDVAVLIRLDTSAQERALCSGAVQPRNIKFIALHDTPMNDSIKILKVETHLTWGGLFESTNMTDKEVVVAWLDDLGVTNYPDYNVSY